MRLTLRHVYIANGILIGALISVGVGFFLGREFPAAPKPAAPPAEAALPAGVTRLPQANFNAWALNCVQNAQGAKHCELSMRAFDPKQNGVVMQLVATRGGNGKPLLAIMTPSNASLGPGVRLVLGNQGTTIPFQNCTVQACEALTALEGQLLYLINSSPNVQVGYSMSTGRPINYQLPTTGFDKGYAAWGAQEPGLPPIPATASPPPGPANPAAANAKPANPQGSTPATKPKPAG